MYPGSCRGGASESEERSIRESSTNHGSATGRHRRRLPGSAVRASLSKQSKSRPLVPMCPHVRSTLVFFCLCLVWPHGHVCGMHGSGSTCVACRAPDLCDNSSAATISGAYSPTFCMRCFPRGCVPGRCGRPQRTAPRCAASFHANSKHSPPLGQDHPEPAHTSGGPCLPMPH